MEPELKNIRHVLHQFPSLSGQESETTNLVSQFLKKLAPTAELIYLGRTGLAAIFKGTTEGPTLLLRCELDALAIHEDLDIPHRSQRSGVSHKCGHDGHMATLLGVAEKLDKNPIKKGRVILLFQPAEESGQGALWVLHDPKYVEIKPDFVFSFHNLPHFPLHSIVWRPETFASASTGMVVRLTGTTTHSSYPEHGINPSQLMANIIQQLPLLPKKSLNRKERGLITVVLARLGNFEGRADFGIAPGEAEIRCTLRAHTTEGLNKLKTSTIELIQTLGESTKLEINIEWDEEFPATMSSKQGITILKKAIQEASLEGFQAPEAFRWSEDFGYFLEQTPGAFFGIGSGENQPQLHHPDYDYPDDLLATGIKIYLALINQVCQLSYFVSI